MATRNLVALLLFSLLAGCASTQGNYASKGIALDDGSFYFPAQEGQGDYYYGAPARESRFEFNVGLGYGPFGSSRSCRHAWYCASWPYGHGFGYRPFFHHPYFDFGYGWAWRGGDYPRQGGSHHEHASGAVGSMTPDLVGPSRPGDGEKPLPRNRGRTRLPFSEASAGGEAQAEAGQPGQSADPAAGGHNARRTDRVDRQQVDRQGRQDFPRPDASTRTVREPANDRIRERSHDRDD